MSSIRDRINNAISQYSVALMSNTKWKVVFEKIAEHQLLFSIAYVREHHYGAMQKITDLHLEDNYIPDGVLVGGPVFFNEIFGVKINRFKTSKNPATGANFETDTHSVSFHTHLDNLGKYPIEVTDKYIYIHGYK